MQGWWYDKLLISLEMWKTEVQNNETIANEMPYQMCNDD